MGTTPLRSDLAALPDAPGVYRFRDARGRELYIGRATSLRSRVRSYWTGLGDRTRLQRMVDQVTRVEAVVCDSSHEAAWLERNLLTERLPRWNRAVGGEEAPAYALLTSTAGSPGLRQLHRPLAPTGGRLFGPYLGGQRTRTAMSGLHRALPLSYTAAGAAGSTAEMGRILGVGPTDRERLAAALAATLDRDADAVAQVRATLVAARDRAAETEDYERAGLIQDELRAVEWLTSPQRMTELGTRSLEIHGWCDGVLVGLTMHEGRMCGWRVTRCSHATASARVARTPPEWRGFASANAALAAALG